MEKKSLVLLSIIEGMTDGVIVGLDIAFSDFWLSDDESICRYRISEVDFEGKVIEIRKVSCQQNAVLLLEVLL